MLYWAAIFFITAVVAGIFGFGEITLASVEIAKVLFFVFLIGFILSVILHFTGRNEYKWGD